jgi:hypothetical protein
MNRSRIEDGELEKTEGEEQKNVDHKILCWTLERMGDNGR